MDIKRIFLWFLWTFKRLIVHSFFNGFAMYMTWIRSISSEYGETFPSSYCHRYRCAFSSLKNIEENFILAAIMIR